MAQQQHPGGQAAPAADTTTPFAFADFTWLNGVPRNKDEVVDSKYFRTKFRADTSYIHDYSHPIDHSLGGTTEGARTGEVQVQHVGVGGDFHAGNMKGRVLTQFGVYATATPRNDASPSVGQWDLANAYHYVTEAWGGYHVDVQHGINVQAGLFLSYIGLLSYYNFDNWSYQRILRSGAPSAEFGFQPGFSLALQAESISSSNSGEAAVNLFFGLDRAGWSFTLTPTF